MCACVRITRLMKHLVLEYEAGAALAPRGGHDFAVLHAQLAALVAGVENGLAALILGRIIQIGHYGVHTALLVGADEWTVAMRR